MHINDLLEIADNFDHKLLVYLVFENYFQKKAHSLLT